MSSTFITEENENSDSVSVCLKCIHKHERGITELPE